MRTVRDATLDVLRARGLTTGVRQPGSTELPMLKEFPEDFRYVLASRRPSSSAWPTDTPSRPAGPPRQPAHRPRAPETPWAPSSTPAPTAPPWWSRPGSRSAACSASRPSSPIPSPPSSRSRRQVGLGAARPADVPHALARAVQVAETPPHGPVFLSLPMDDWDTRRHRREQGPAGRRPAHHPRRRARHRGAAVSRRPDHHGVLARPRRGRRRRRRRRLGTGPRPRRTHRHARLVRTGLHTGRVPPRPPPVPGRTRTRHRTARPATRRPRPGAGRRRPRLPLLPVRPRPLPAGRRGTGPAHQGRGGGRQGTRRRRPGRRPAADRQRPAGAPAGRPAPTARTAPAEAPTWRTATSAPSRPSPPSRARAPADTLWINESPSNVPQFHDATRISAPGSYLFSAGGDWVSARPPPSGRSSPRPAGPWSPSSETAPCTTPSRRCGPPPPTGSRHVRRAQQPPLRHPPLVRPGRAAPAPPASTSPPRRLRDRRRVRRTRPPRLRHRRTRQTRPRVGTPAGRAGAHRRPDHHRTALAVTRSAHARKAAMPATPHDARVLGALAAALPDAALRTDGATLERHASDAAPFSDRARPSPSPSPRRPNRSSTCCAPPTPTTCRWCRRAPGPDSPARPTRWTAASSSPPSAWTGSCPWTPANRLVRCEPGVTTKALNDAVAAHGLTYPPDPASWERCTIGGNIATGAGVDLLRQVRSHRRLRARPRPRPPRRAPHPHRPRHRQGRRRLRPDTARRRLRRHPRRRRRRHPGPAARENARPVAARPVPAPHRGGRGGRRDHRRRARALRPGAAGPGHHGGGRRLRALRCCAPATRPRSSPSSDGADPAPALEAMAELCRKAGAGNVSLLGEPGRRPPSSRPAAW